MPGLAPIPADRQRGVQESEMAETWEVARTTAHRAIALLRDQCLVQTVPQRGTYLR